MFCSSSLATLVAWCIALRCGFGFTEEAKACRDEPEILEAEQVGESCKSQARRPEHVGHDGYQSDLHNVGPCRNRQKWVRDWIHIRRSASFIMFCPSGILKYADLQTSLHLSATTPLPLDGHRIPGYLFPEYHPAKGTKSCRTLSNCTIDAFKFNVRRASVCSSEKVAGADFHRSPSPTGEEVSLQRNVRSSSSGGADEVPFTQARKHLPEVCRIIPGHRVPGAKACFLRSVFACQA